MSFMQKIIRLFFPAFFILSGALPARAWDYEGHRLVNQLALASLQADFPAFVKTPEARERIAFLAGEPDRWRNAPDLPLRHFNGPDHYIDLEDLPAYGLDAKNLPHFRYDFTAQLALARAAHPNNFPGIDPLKNDDHTRQLVGFLPWALAENYAKLKSGFSYLKALEENGTPEEVSNAQQNILYIMGVMGHYAGDSVQPLHTTKHFNGWVGENPNHYATNLTFHSWIDGGYLRKIGGLHLDDLKPKIKPAHSIVQINPATRQDEIFPVVMTFILEQHKFVETVYQLNKQGSLSDAGEETSKGRAFMTEQIIKGGEFLGNLWYSAWQNAPPDSYLKSQLLRRTATPAPARTPRPKPDAVQ